MDMSYEAALLKVADAYAARVAEHGGKSLARVATIVVNRGSFFDRLRDGAGCSSRSLDRLFDWFRDPTNWPANDISSEARAALVGVGRPALCTTCDHRLTDTAIRACPVRGCPHAQREAA
ncbi:hypothetical protein [Sphingomonas bisphenolicum]